MQLQRDSFMYNIDNPVLLLNNTEFLNFLVLNEVPLTCIGCFFKWSLSQNSIFSMRFCLHDHWLFLCCSEFRVPDGVLPCAQHWCAGKQSIECKQSGVPCLISPLDYSPWWWSLGKWYLGYWWHTKIWSGHQKKRNYYFRNTTDNINVATFWQKIKNVHKFLVWVRKLIKGQDN